MAPAFPVTPPSRFIASPPFELVPFKLGVIVVDPGLSHSLSKNLALLLCGLFRGEETEWGSSPFSTWNILETS